MRVVAVASASVSASVSDSVPASASAAVATVCGVDGLYDVGCLPGCVAEPARMSLALRQLPNPFAIAANLSSLVPS